MAVKRDMIRFCDFWFFLERYHKAFSIINFFIINAQLNIL
jgi:hypothetical protein